MKISSDFREFIWNGFPEDKKSPADYNIFEKRDFLSYFIKSLSRHDIEKFFSYLTVKRDDLPLVICASLAQLFDTKKQNLNIADVIMSECFEYFIEKMEGVMEKEYNKWYREAYPPMIFPNDYSVNHYNQIRGE
jgi:hypothetical protein